MKFISLYLSILLGSYPLLLPGQPLHAQSSPAPSLADRGITTVTYSKINTMSYEELKQVQEIIKTESPNTILNPPSSQPNINLGVSLDFNNASNTLLTVGDLNAAIDSKLSNIASTYVTNAYQNAKNNANQVMSEQDKKTLESALKDLKSPIIKENSNFQLTPTDQAIIDTFESYPDFFKMSFASHLASTEFNGKGIGALVALLSQVNNKDELMRLLKLKVNGQPLSEIIMLWANNSASLAFLAETIKQTAATLPNTNTGNVTCIIS